MPVVIKPRVLGKGHIPFQTDGRLLQELGLRLVASPEVALVELIKNAYDADSPSCTVKLERDDQDLVVIDEGSGMTLADFRTKWMRIATSSKLSQEFSPKFRRPLTGAKGIGRFAGRFLGDHLLLESVAYDPKYKCKTRLSAKFDWQKLEAVRDMSKIAVDYQLTKAPSATNIGTTLTISKLRSTTDFVRSPALRNDVLKIVSPIQGLDRGSFTRSSQDLDQDPGFEIVLPGEVDHEDVDLVKLILQNYWAKLTIEHKNNAVEYKVYFPSSESPRALKVALQSSIVKGFFADILFFPRRGGVFQDKGINGKKAWEWVRDNSGVAVVDHGFRIKPYGMPNDDWLRIDVDKAHSERDWKTLIAKAHFPVSAAIKNDPARNPVLNLAYNLQLVGAVFIESKPGTDESEEMILVPSMDREGLLRNAAFAQLRELVRAGIEFLAHEDKAELDRIATAKAKEAARKARADIRKAIVHIQSSPTLTAADKARITNQYTKLADQVEEQEEYSEQARKSLMTMGLLGVVAGFMTHESRAISHELEQAIKQVQALASKHPELKQTAENLSRRLGIFEGYLKYARMFVQNVRGAQEQSLSSSGQVAVVITRFKTFALERGIHMLNEIDADVKTPPLPVTVYSGVLLNLLTNALKALIAGKSSVRDPQVCFRAWNEKGKHFVEVLDNGIGIPEAMQKRVWEPLYTTTSDSGNPLGSGMGLGLTLVKQVVAEFNGTISLVIPPPAGFNTCFRVILPFAK